MVSGPRREQGGSLAAVPSAPTRSRSCPPRGPGPAAVLSGGSGSHCVKGDSAAPASTSPTPPQPQGSWPLPPPRPPLLTLGLPGGGI